MEEVKEEDQKETKRRNEDNRHKETELNKSKFDWS